ncbi:MAG: LLM class flavin-dependent oxidoreductase [Microbacterium sp.]|uniref:LLM class flavin-dependent oxidoreductase n=1 Tax=Microbacterium sp. TaxID=51671 RepID=UPI001AD30226|nr:LLM class flavin-dependent oxidoreductase [Microbacterium sp.]MBN9178419.1 LLM class flavin-dependent oxidoreductase [Microbacterium sp.]
MSRVPLSVLDLSPFGIGQSPATGLRTTLELARAAEAFGYRRFWLAEHHFNSGIAGSAPHVLLAAVAATTERIRVGTAATIIGNYSPAQVAEAIGVVAALHPGRVDLGIGRSGARPPAPAQVAGDREVDGLLIPAATTVFPFDAPRFVAQARALGRGDDVGDRFAEDVADILAYFSGPSAAPGGVTLHATPAEGQSVETWIHGSTPGPSARLAGALGLPFGANYHVAPSFVLDAIAAYRSAFRPGRLPAPQVIVSVDVLVAETDAEAERLGAGYGRWVHSIRAGDGAAPYPAPDDAAADPLTPAEEEIVRDRLRTRFVGSPHTVVARLETLQRVTGADELLVTTIAHDPADRIASYRLLADAWGGGGREDAAASDPADGATTGDDVTIRLVRTEEYARAGEVTAAAYIASYGALSDQYLTSLRDVAARVREGDVWVATDPTGDLLGTVWVSRPNRPLNPDIGRPGETDFRQLAVAPHARGRGIGEALTRHVIALAAERGSHRVVMNSGPEMTGAHALYTKLGFRRLPEREQERELEPGRVVTLLAFGYDLDAANDGAASAASWRIEHVAWDDPRAEALRERMDAEVGPRYADAFSAADADAAAHAFSIDPATIVATIIATDRGGAPLGHAALRDLAHDGTRDLEIKRFYVHPRARGLGLSRALLAELERIGRERGAPRLVLQTGDRQHDAVVLYEKAGYARIAPFEPYTPFALSRCFAKELTAAAAVP